jgi:V8-like Glu-specific endopeptidase
VIQLKTPWASIAKIAVDGLHSGTGFLVTRQHVLTALHVVADKSGQPFEPFGLRRSMIPS